MNEDLVQIKSISDIDVKKINMEFIQNFRDQIYTGKYL